MPSGPGFPAEQEKTPDPDHGAGYRVNLRLISTSGLVGRLQAMQKALEAQPNAADLRRAVSETSLDRWPNPWPASPAPAAPPCSYWGARKRLRPSAGSRAEERLSQRKGKPRSADRFPRIGLFVGPAEEDPEDRCSALVDEVPVPEYKAVDKIFARRVILPVSVLEVEMAESFLHAVIPEGILGAERP